MATEALKKLTKQELYNIREEAGNLIRDINIKEQKEEEAKLDAENAKKLAQVLKNKKVFDAIKVLKSAQKNVKKHFKIVIEFDMEYRLKNPARTNGFTHKQINIKSNIKDRGLNLNVRRNISDACKDILGLLDLTNIEKAQRVVNDHLTYHQIQSVFNCN